MTDPSQPSPWPRRYLVIAVQLVSVALAIAAVFRMGALWAVRGLAQAQTADPNPFLANFPRYALATLWPIPGAALLFIAAMGFGGGRRWWWLILLAALAWLALYFVVKPPQWYYYWLIPERP